LNQFNIFFKKTQSGNIADEYESKLLRDYRSDQEVTKLFYNFSENELSKPQIQIIPESLMSPNVDPKTLTHLLLGADVIKKSYKILTILGVMYICYYFITDKKNNYDLRFVLLLGISLSVLLAFSFLPFLSIDYDLFRTYHQLLVILALPSVLGITVSLNRIKAPYPLMIAVFFFSLYFVLSSRLFYQLIGGYPSSLVLANSGDDYDRYYISKADMLSTEWIGREKGRFTPIHTDSYTRFKLRALTTEDLHITDELTPISIVEQSYVLLSSSNVRNNTAFKNFNNRLIKFIIPTEFINVNKNVVYSNSKSVVFR
jgi:uncharacterized membrane protein